MDTAKNKYFGLDLRVYTIRENLDEGNGSWIGIFVLQTELPRPEGDSFLSPAWGWTTVGLKSTIQQNGLVAPEAVAKPNLK